MAVKPPGSGLFFMGRLSITTLIWISLICSSYLLDLILLGQMCLEIHHCFLDFSDFWNITVSKYFPVTLCVALESLLSHLKFYWFWFLSLSLFLSVVWLEVWHSGLCFQSINSDRFTVLLLQPPFYSSLPWSLLFLATHCFRSGLLLRRWGAWLG